MRNLWYLCRSLMQGWVFTTVAVATLALGIGASSSVLILVNTLLFRPLPYADNDRVVNLWSPSIGHTESVLMTVSPADFLDWQRRSSSFSAMAAFSPVTSDLVGFDTPENVAGASVTTDFFEVLGVRPQLGRAFESKDDHQQVIILSHGLWQRDFGSRTSAIGEKLFLSGQPYTIIGVMPSGFVHPEPLSGRTTEFWRPSADFSRMPRGFRFLRVVARLKPEVSLSTATAEMNQIMAQLAREFPETNRTKTAMVVPLREQMFGTMYRPLFLLLAVAAIVLLIACANVSNLQLARTNSRFHQLLIRFALGAKLRHLILWIFGESLLLALLGTVGGLVIGSLALYILRLVAPASIHGLDHAIIDFRMVLFAASLAMLSTLLIGVPPSVRLFRLRTEMRGQLGSPYRGDAPSRQKLQSLIMLAQIALVLPLLIATLLLTRSFIGLLHVNPGYDPSHLLTLRVNPSPPRYPGPAAIQAFLKEFVQSIKTIPGVGSVAVTSSVPLTEFNTQLSIGVSVQPGTTQNESRPAYYRVVDPSFFETMKIPLLSGRNFVESDNPSSLPVAIVNASFTREYGGQGLIDKPIFLFKGSSPVQVTVVGVVGDIHSESLAAPPAPELYAPFAQDPSLAMAVTVRTGGDPSSLIGPIRSKSAELDKQLALRDIHSMDEIIYERTSIQRFAVLLITLSSGLALTLALIGVGGVVAYIITEKAREFAIRMAIGATHTNIIRSVLVYVLKFGSCGIVIGLVIAFNVSRIPAYLIYGVRPVDLINFSIASVVLIAALLVTAYVPLRAVLRIDPAVSLRAER